MHHVNFGVAYAAGQFSGWENARLDKLGKVVTRTSLVSEEQARKTLGNYPMFTYQYKHVMHSMRQQLQVMNVRRPLTAFEILDQGIRKKALFRIYQILINQDQIGIQVRERGVKI